MLLQFNVTNAMSFRDEAILDLVAGVDNSHSECLIPFRKDRVLPSVAIFGANASGKSNLFKALTQAILFIRNSNKMQVHNKIGIVPFLLDDSSRNKKTRFDFVFVRNQVKYEYGFVADADRVYEEYLYEYCSAKPSMIFERYDVHKYRYTSRTKELKAIEDKNSENMLFLATATTWNSKLTKEPFLWFAENIDTYDAASVKNGMVEALDSNDSEAIKHFMMSVLKAADFNISDYKFEIKDSDISNISLMPGLSIDENVLSNLKEWNIDVFHDIETNGNLERFFLPFNQESNGTCTIFGFGPLIYLALKSGKTLVVDELDNGLHPLLVEYLVSIFNNPEINKNGAQLIFNTHDDNLLDLDILRRDQIYFVEKNYYNATSELYSLSDFSPRKNELIQKRYLQGRFGALPNINKEGTEW